MKATLHLEDDDFETYTHALGYCLILNDIENKFRERMKYGDLESKVYNELEVMRAYIYERKQVYHLPLN